MGNSLADVYVMIRGDDRRLRSDFAKTKAYMMAEAKSFVGMASTVMATLGIGSAAAGVLALGKAFVTTNDRLEQYRVSLGVLLKDQERANLLIKDVEKMAAETPFTTDSLMKSIQLLRTFGVETNKLLPMIRSIGDAAAASPQGMEFAVQRISLAIGQMKAANKIHGNDLLQLSQAGVPALEILEKAFGDNIENVKKKVKDGAIHIDTVIAALMAGLDARFSGMMSRQSRTFTGLMSTLRDNLTILVRRLGEPLFQIASVKLDNLVEWTKGPGFDAFVNEWQPVVRDAAIWVSQLVKRAVEMRGTFMQLVGYTPQVIALFAAFKAAGMARDAIVILSGAVMSLGMAGGPLTVLAGVVAAVAAAMMNAKVQGISYGESILDLTNKITGLNNAYSRLKKHEAFESRFGQAVTAANAPIDKMRAGHKAGTPVAEPVLTPEQSRVAESVKVARAGHEAVIAETEAGIAQLKKALAEANADERTARNRLQEAGNSWSAWLFGSAGKKEVEDVHTKAIKDAQMAAASAANQLAAAEEKLAEVRGESVRIGAEAAANENKKIADEKGSKAMLKGFGRAGANFYSGVRSVFGDAVGGLASVKKKGMGAGAAFFDDMARRQAELGKKRLQAGGFGAEKGMAEEIRALQEKERKQREMERGADAIAKEHGLDREVVLRRMQEIEADKEDRDKEAAQAEKDKEKKQLNRGMEFVGLTELNRRIQSSIMADPGLKLQQKQLAVQQEQKKLQEKELEKIDQGNAKLDKLDRLGRFV